MKKRLWMPALLAGSVILTGCDNNDDATSTVGSEEAQATALLRAVHLSPDAPAVDVLVSGSVALEDVLYRQASGFLSLAAGVTPVAVNVANTDTSVIAADLDLAADSRVTVLAVNAVASIEPLVIVDDTPPTENFASLRVIHGAPQAPAVDVYVSAPDTAFTAGSPLLANVPFKGISDELNVAAGDYRVRVTLAGGDTPIYDSGTLSLSAGVEYVAVASEVSGGLSPIGLTVLTDSADTPVVLADDARARVRVVHASADAPAVDVSVDGNVVLDAVTFGQASDYLEVLGDTYNVDVAADASGASVINADLEFEPRTDTTVAAINSLSQIEPLVLSDDNSAPATGNVKVRLVHAAPTAGLVDVYVTAPGADLSVTAPLIEDFAFREDSGYLEVPAGDYQVRIAVADTLTVAIDTGTLSLSAGVIRTAFALDPAPGSSDFGVLLLNDRN